MFLCFIMMFILIEIHRNIILLIIKKIKLNKAIHLYKNLVCMYYIGAG